MSWPARINDKGALREQFVHVIDVVPTILEAAGIRAPEIVDGPGRDVRQLRIERPLAFREAIEMSVAAARTEMASLP